MPGKCYSTGPAEIQALAVDKAVTWHCDLDVMTFSGLSLDALSRDITIKRLLSIFLIRGLKYNNRL